MNLKIIKNINNKNAFSLLELLLYISLLLSIIVILFSILTLFYTNKIKNKTVLEVQQQGLIISELISQEIRNAQAINSPAPSNSSDALSLEPFDLTRNPIIFSLVDNKLIISEAGLVNSLSNNQVNIKNLNFENISTAYIDSIIFSFDIEYNSNSLRNEYKYEKSFSNTINLLKQ